MGAFDGVIDGIAGLLRLVPEIKKAYDTTGNGAFKKSIMPGACLITRSIEPDAVQRLIQAGSHSAWQHVIAVYVGQTMGNMIRRMYPELITNTKIPLRAKHNEIIESTAKGVVVSTLDLSGKQQMECYQKPYRQDTFMRLLKNAYDEVGKPYDYLEYGQHGGSVMKEIIPNDPNLVVCSTLRVKICRHFEIPVCKKVNGEYEFDPQAVAPKHIRRYYFRNLSYERLRWNCK